MTKSDATEHDLLQACLAASRLGAMDQARALALELIGAPAFEDRPLLRLDARIRLSWIEFQDGRHAVARDVAEMAIAEAQNLGDASRESIARSHYARLLSEDLESIRSADEAVMALRLARLSTDSLALSTALVVPAIICSRLGLYDAAVELAQQAVNVAKRSGDTEAIAHCISNYGSLHADYLYRFAIATPAQRHGFLDIAINHSRRATEYARDHRDSEMQRLSGYNLVEFLLLAGDNPAAEQAMIETDSAPGTPSRRSQVQRGHVHAHLILSRGDLAPAIIALQESLERCLAYPFFELAVFVAEEISDCLAKLEDFEAAYHAHRRFHDLYCRHTNEDGSRHMQSSILHDRIEEMRALIAEEEGRASRLEYANALLLETAERLAQENLEDPLTGVGNRRRLDHALTELGRRAENYAVAVLDIDHFKQVNDRYSHTVGDDVLRAVAQLIRRSLDLAGAADDLVARLGGEEFAIVFTWRSAAFASNLCETLRLSVQDHQWSDMAPGLSITISIGLAWSDILVSPAECLTVADARLYDAKHEGRNRVVPIGPPPAQEDSGRHLGSVWPDFPIPTIVPRSGSN
jgi:two-component system cell cycle response regulator